MFKDEVTLLGSKDVFYFNSSTFKTSFSNVWPDTRFFFFYIYLVCVYIFTVFNNTKSLIFRETHLWYVLHNEVKSQSLLSQYVDLLSPLEKDHVFSIRGDEQQKSALLARALVRTSIARCRAYYFMILVLTSFFSLTHSYLTTYLHNICSWLDQIRSQVSPKSLQFRKNAHGKPEVRLIFLLVN